MLEKLRTFFAGGESTDGTSEPQLALDLACAALLVEVAAADYVEDPREYDVIAETVGAVLNVDAADIAALIQEAQSEVKESISLYPYTSLINDHCSPDDKYKVIKAMWRVAYADGDLDKYEMHLIRKVAGLIYLPDDEVMRAKRDARDQSA